MVIPLFMSTLSTAESKLQIINENANFACCDDENNLGKRPRERWQNMSDCELLQKFSQSDQEKQASAEETPAWSQKGTQYSKEILKQKKDACF